MSNLYPPILESQRESLPSLPLSGEFFSIPFTMPTSVVISEIGHVQVLIRRQISLESWSTQIRPVSVPEKETIYLPGFLPSIEAHGKNCLRQSGSLWYVDVPISLIRGITSVGGGDTGFPGFPAGDLEEGEFFTIQLRFGDSPLTFSATNEFASWEQTQIINTLFGEWSNTQKMFVYSLPEGATGIEDLFSISVADDPIAKMSWQYTPVSVDPLVQVRVSYSWSTPDAYGNTFQSKNVDFTSEDSRGASAAGVIDLGIMRFAPITATLQFITQNNTTYTWVSDDTNFGKEFLFIKDIFAQGTIVDYPIVGEERDDGLLALTFTWNWSLNSILGEYRIYRVDPSTLEVILLKTVKPLPTAIIGDAISTTIKDYSVEMGEEYLYIPHAYDGNGNYLSTLNWTPEGELTPQKWNPVKFVGYRRQMNFEGNIFITNKWQQLRLQGNLQVTNFKRNTNDTFVTTIGSEYPFYSRTSQSKYRSLNLQGIVSMNFDTTNTFLSFKSQILTSEMEIHLSAAAERYQTDIQNIKKDELYVTNLTARQAQYYGEIYKIYQGINPLTGIPFLIPGTKPAWMTGQLWFKENRDVERIILRATELFSEKQISINAKRIMSDGNPDNQKIVRATEEMQAIRGAATAYSIYFARDTTPLMKSERTDDIIYAERKFRDAVMSWASDGKPKLFRSETEGNMIVVFSGVTFTPFDKNRRVFSMSATVTEIAEYNLENLIKYDLIPIEFTSFYMPDLDFGFIPGDVDSGLRPWRYLYETDPYLLSVFDDRILDRVDRKY